MRRSVSEATLLIVATLVGSVALPASLLAARPDAAPPADARDLFEAVEAGDIEVNLIVRDAENARIVAKNKTDKPMTIKLPEAFAAMPVLAQAGGGQGGGGGGGQGFFNLPPEKVAKHDVGFLCLEHGKPDPRSTMKYEIRPIEDITTNPHVIEVVRQFGHGNYGHSAAQATVWHLQNNISWAQLAQKRKRHLNGTSEPYFKPIEIRQALNIMKHVTELVKKQQGSESKSASDSLSLAK